MDTSKAVHLIGEKLGHSRSPELHALYGNYDYVLTELLPKQVESFVRTGEYLGLNVTVPYKRAVYAVCDELTDDARATGSVNTVYKRGGRLIGDNTDCCGFEALLKHNGIELSGACVLVLGSGGTSHTVQTVARRHNADKIYVASRTGEPDYKGVYALSPDIIINTTPVGMYQNIDAAPVDIKRFPHTSAVVDVIYNPLRTRILTDAKLCGVPVTANGLYMLASQAAKSSELFFGTKIDESDVYAAGERLRLSAQNTVYIGMPGAGKSTLARREAKLTGKPMFDTDEIVEQTAGISVSEIFVKYGEKEFRRMEKEAIMGLAGVHGAVIAAGGGAVCDMENVYALMSNGYIKYVVRSLELLDRAGRPLSGDAAAIIKLSEERTPIYEAMCDERIYNG